MAKAATQSHAGPTGGRAADAAPASAAGMSRRGLLRGRFQARLALRPPGAVGDDLFHDLCSSCGDCARACPEGIVFRDTQGLPVLNLNQGSCTFCAKCTQACATGALRPETAWPWRAFVASPCLNSGGVACRSCQDHCDAGAISIRPQIGGRAALSLDTRACTGCGGCIAVCPAAALELRPLSQTDEVPPC